MTQGDYIRDLITARYKADLYKFFIDAWKVLEPETPLVENWHLRFLAKELTKILKRVKAREPRDKNTIINIPPSTTKSTLITVVFPVWAWIIEPSLKFITMSYNESLAITHAVKSRDIIQSDWYQTNFGHIYNLKYDVNKKSEFANDKGGSRIAIGVLGGATGKHGDILICDDPSDPRRAASEVDIIRVNNWWDKTISTRMTNPNVSHKLIVMQRLAVRDLTGHCLTNKTGQYDHICLPAEITDKTKVIPSEVKKEYQDGLLDPVRLSRKVLQQMQVALGSTSYAGQYLQDPKATDGTLVKPEWFRQFTMEQVRTRVETIEDPLTWHVFIDGAYTEDTTNAPTSLLCAAIIGKEVFIRDVQRVWMELPELTAFIPEFLSRNGGNQDSRIYVEPKASGLSIVQTLRRYSTLNIVADKPPTTGKLQRFKACLPFIESGRVSLLRGATWQELFMDELLSFPSEGQYKDIVDTTVMAIARVDSGVLSGSIIGIASF